MRNNNTKRVSNTYRRTKKRTIPLSQPLYEPNSKPTMVLWRADFTVEDPYYRLSFAVDETPQRMVYNLLGIDISDYPLPKDKVLALPFHGTIMLVTNWEIFLRVAEDEQVKEVQSFVCHITGCDK